MLHGGAVLKHTGDGIIAVFDNGRALECALHAQIGLNRADWSEVGGLAVRICVFAGEAEERDGDFFGPAMNGAARMMSAAWGGQVLANEAASWSEILPDGASLVDAGVHVLRDLAEPQQIFILAHPSIPSEFPALRTVSSRPQNLPVQPTPFHGRARELDEVCELIGTPSCRLLTIHAPGGTGKSRLALQVAARVITDFRHGAFFVRLEDVTAAAMIPATFARAMSLRFSGPLPEEEQLASFLSDRETLLIADNFEHLTDDAPLLTRLLGRCPGLRIVVTSRHRLNLREEQVYELKGMALPAPDGSDLEDCDASVLFLASADRAMPGYNPGRNDRPSISAICRLVDGSPLGIELASSWVRMVAPADMEMQLHRGFELLDSAPRDMPGRHRGLEAVFEYSWSLLDDAERMALTGISVFAGEFDANAASEVAGCGLPVLRRLLDKSLVQCSVPGRFGLHPIVRAFAAARQREDPVRQPGLIEAHARFYAARLEEGRDGPQQADFSEVLKRIESDLPNVLQAWDHAARRWTPEENRIFLLLMSHLFVIRSTTATAIEVFSDMLEVFRGRWGGSPQPGEAGILSSTLERMATFRQLAGQSDASMPLLEEALSLAAASDSKELEPRILGTIGVAQARAGDNAAARRSFERMLERLEAIGDSVQMSVALTNLATLESIEGNWEKGVAFYEQALVHSRRLGDMVSQMRTLGSMGFMLAHADQDGRAFECLEESLAIARKIGDKRSEELALLGMAKILAPREPERAGRLAAECLAIAETIEHVSMQGHAWLVSAEVMARQGLRAEAREAAGRAVAILGNGLDEQARHKLDEIEYLIMHGSDGSTAAGG